MIEKKITSELICIVLFKKSTLITEIIIGLMNVSAMIEITIIEYPAMMSAVFYHAGLSQLTILPLAVITGFFVCVILYYIFIKFTPLNWLINGYSKSSLKIKFLGA